MNSVLDRVYLAMDLALRQLREGCECGCSDDAQDALVEAMRDLEEMTTVPS